jgi:hypothetical protein
MSRRVIHSGGLRRDPIWRLACLGPVAAHANRLGQIAVKGVGLAVLVLQTPLAQLSCDVVQHGDLLAAGMKSQLIIKTVRLLLPSLGR